MFIDRLEVHNNTTVKNTTYLAHTHYIIIYCHVKDKISLFQTKKSIVYM